MAKVPAYDRSHYAKFGVENLSMFLSTHDESLKKGHSDKHQIITTLQTSVSSRLEFIENTLETYLQCGAAAGKNEEIFNSSSPKRQKHEKSLHNFVQIYRRNIAAQIARKTDECDLFKCMLAIFHLCDILYFQEDESKTLPESLASWLNQHYSIESEINEVIEFISPNKHPQFWPLIEKSILRGDFKNACNLLSKSIPSLASSSQSPRGKTSALDQILIRLLQGMPQSNRAFHAKLLEWQRECEYHRDSEDAMKDAKYATVFGILSGNKDCIIQSAEIEWMEMIVALMLFKYPTITVQDIPHLLDTIDIKDKVELLSVAERSIYSFLDTDVNKGVRLCSEIDFWLVSHLGDLFSKANFMEDDLDLEHQPCKYSEWLMINYVVSLFGSFGEAWSKCLDYLLHCPTFGMSYIRLLIMRVPLDNVETVEKIFAFCTRHGLEYEAAAIHRTIARHKLNQGLFSQAIQHYANAHETKLVDSIAKGLLKDYLYDGNHSEFFAVVDSLPVNTLYETSSCLSFLGQYREFHRCYSEGKDYREAGRLLCTMLTSHVAPKSMWITLLLDAVPLLESKNISLDMDETYEMMRFLEDLVNNHRKHEYLAGKEDAVGVARMALVRNLSRAMQHSSI